MDEKKARMAKELLDKIQNDIDADEVQDQEEAEFIKNLKARNDIEKEDVLTEVLKRRAADARGKLHHKVADKLDLSASTTVFIKGHKKAITDFVFSKDEKRIYSVSKDCCILEWDLETNTKTVFNKGKKHDRTLKNGGHFDEIIACDLSRDQRLLATGGKDRILRIWNTVTRTLITSFKGHTDTITSIKFDNVNDNLYSVGADKTLKIWNMREMCYMDTHHGHIGAALDIQPYSKDRVISCGDDRQVIFWKVVEDTQLLYKNTKNDTNCLTLIDDEYFCTGSMNSVIDLWTFKKKKPISKLKECHVHNNPNSPHKHAWITSISSIRNADLVSSAGIDSSINFYKFSKENKNLEKIGTLPEEDGFVKGTVNSLKFSPKRSYLAYSHSDEQKLGRWFVSKPSKIGLSIVKLSFK